MSLSVKRVAEDRFTAEATPPHACVAWKTASPASAKELIDDLKGLGCHQQDIGDAMDAADPHWLDRVPMAHQSRDMVAEQGKLQTMESN